MDPITMTLLAIQAASAAKNAFAPNQQSGGQQAAPIPQGGQQFGPPQSISPFEMPMPAQAPQAPPIESNLTDQIAKELAAQGAVPPTAPTPLLPAPPPMQNMPPAALAGPAPTPAPASATGPPEARAGVGGEAPMSIGELLAASPQAIAGIANLLGMGQGGQRHEQAAPIPGGTAGQVVQGFNLPQNLNLGDILARIR